MYLCRSWILMCYLLFVRSSSRGSSTGGNSNCYSSSHSFHVELWNYIKQQSYALPKCSGPAQQKSFHVEVPEPDEEAHQIEVVLENTLAKLANENGDNNSVSNRVVNGISNLHVGDDCWSQSWQQFVVPILVAEEHWYIYLTLIHMPLDGIPRT